MTKREKYQDFAGQLQPRLEAEDEYFANLSVGVELWIPCSGVEKSGTQLVELGHTGVIATYQGNRKFAYGEWTTKDEAIIRGVKPKNETHTLCDSCSKLLDSQ